MKIQSVQRAMQILNLFTFSTPRLGISEISRALNLHKAAVLGLVKTLADGAFLHQDPETRKYQLGLKIYELGFITAGNLEINRQASNPVHELAKKTQSLVHVAIPQENSAVITLDAYPRSTPFLSRQFGPRVALYCTALGKIFLAFMEQNEIEAYISRSEFVRHTPNTILGRGQLMEELKETRNRGYSINREEHLLNRAAIGAPVFGRDGRVVASIALVRNPRDILGEQLEVLAKEVTDTALEISKSMGYFPETNVL
jgi:IclR family KDG regulon transcriptional repressor